MRTKVSKLWYANYIRIHDAVFEKCYQETLKLEIGLVKLIVYQNRKNRLIILLLTLFS